VNPSILLIFGIQVFKSSKLKKIYPEIEVMKINYKDVRDFEKSRIISKYLEKLIN
jgi:hypothetical protein